MYTVTLEIYQSKEEQTREFTNQAEARIFAQGISLLANALKWTRHCNVTKLIETNDSYHDLYNEGSIVLKPKHKENN